MTSSSLSCPVCETTLILNQANVGSETPCPGCGVRLRMPDQLDSTEPPTVVRKSPAPAASPPPAAPGPESLSTSGGGGAALPSGRARSSDDELRRLAGAAGAAGGAHSFTPEEAARLAAERGKTVLPSRRSADSVPATGAAFNNERRDAQPASADNEPPLPGSAPIAPLSPKIHQQVDMSPSPLVGGARNLPQAPAPAPVPPAAPAPGPEGATPDAETAAEEAGSAKSNFRLNERTPQFVPQEIIDTDVDAKEWGGEQTPQETARTRRVVTLALAVMLLIAGGVAVYITRQAFTPPVTETKSVEEAEDPMKNVESARAVMKRFLAASTVEEMAAEVRHPEETKARIERFYAGKKIAPLTIRGESSQWGEASINDRNFISNTMELSDFDIRSVSLELFADGPPKVDWESWVNWSEMPWADFLSHPPDDAMEFRVSATQDDFYTGAFNGREFDMLCFKLRSPKKSQYEFCYGYCDKNSEVGTQILFMQRRARQARKLDEKGKPLANCILRLRFSPEGKKFNQLMIEKMVFQGWVKP